MGFIKYMIHQCFAPSWKKKEIEREKEKEKERKVTFHQTVTTVHVWPRRSQSDIVPMKFIRLPLRKSRSVIDQPGSDPFERSRSSLNLKPLMSAIDHVARSPIRSPARKKIDPWFVRP